MRQPNAEWAGAAKRQGRLRKRCPAAWRRVFRAHQARCVGWLLHMAGSKGGVGPARMSPAEVSFAAIDPVTCTSRTRQGVTTLRVKSHEATLLNTGVKAGQRHASLEGTRGARAVPLVCQPQRRLEPCWETPPLPLYCAVATSEGMSHVNERIKTHWLESSIHTKVGQTSKRTVKRGVHFFRIAPAGHVRIGACPPPRSLTRTKHKTAVPVCFKWGERESSSC